MKYLWDIVAWVKLVIAPVINKSLMNKWLNALLVPVQDLHTDFLLYRLAILRKIKVNSQTCVLETLLNELFDASAKRIYIITVSDHLRPLTIYTDAENRPVYIRTKAENIPTFIYTWIELNLAYHFMVIVPVGILTSAQERQIKAFTNYYRLASKKPIFKYDNNVTF
jgi:hypothetical protein